MWHQDTKMEVLKNSYLDSKKVANFYCLESQLILG